MKLFIVPIPVFDSNMAVVAYHVAFQQGDRLFGLANDFSALSEAMYSPAVEMINTLGMEPFTGGKPVFVDINQFQFLADVPHQCYADPNLFVITLSRDLPTEGYILDKLDGYKADGYKVALNNIPHTKETAPLYKRADYIIMDSHIPQKREVFRFMHRNYRSAVKMFINVNDQAFFDDMNSLPTVLFEGNFYSLPITHGTQTVSALKTNALRLINIVQQEDFDLDAVSDIIKRDPKFTISLLQFINSPAIGIRQKISSINAAVALLGQTEVKKWITVAVSTHLGDDKPTEVTKLSLIRAKFAENIATAFEMGVHAPSLFLAGLFSLLDVMLDKPMEEAIQEVFVDQKIHQALVDKQGPMSSVLKLIDLYEHANWEAVSIMIIRRSIELDAISQAYMDALVWYRDLINAPLPSEEDVFNLEDSLAEN